MTKGELITILELYKIGRWSLDGVLIAVEKYSSASNDAKPHVSGSLPPMVNPDENNGWSFDYKLLEKVADAACEIEEGVSMEDVDAILTVLWRQ